jgi:hypothetical protein
MEDIGMKNKYVIYRESKPGIVDPLRDAVAEKALQNSKLKFEFEGIKTHEFINLVDGVITGFDDDSLSVVVGIVYNGEEGETDPKFLDWILKEFFDFLLPGTWDLNYYNESPLSGFMSDFRFHKRISRE